MTIVLTQHRLEGGVHAFRYLQSEVTTLADVDEAEALRNTLDAMSIVGLNATEQVSASAPPAGTGILYPCDTVADRWRHQAEPQCRAKHAQYAVRACATTSAGLGLSRMSSPGSCALVMFPLCLLPQESVLSIVAAVLHLGNVEFAQNSADEAVLASAAAQEELDVAASLLQVGQPIRENAVQNPDLVKPS